MAIVILCGQVDFFHRNLATPAPPENEVACLTLMTVAESLPRKLTAHLDRSLQHHSPLQQGIRLRNHLGSDQFVSCFVEQRRIF